MSDQKPGPSIVLPGDFVDEVKGRKTGVGIYIKDDKAYAEVVGVPRSSMYEVSVIPLSGKYIPEFGDKVVGIVKGVEASGWMININSPYIGFLPVSEGVEDFVDSRTDISKFFDTGDVIFCKISRVTKSKLTQCSMRDVLARKLNGGVVIEVTPSKIPRIIGKAGSMINLIKDSTKTDIFTGQNGRIWIRGDDKELAMEAIGLIDRESHKPGLTEKVEKLLGGGNNGA